VSESRTGNCCGADSTLLRTFESGELAFELGVFEERVESCSSAGCGACADTILSWSGGRFKSEGATLAVLLLQPMM
jgi:hypothetical protein